MDDVFYGSDLSDVYNGTQVNGFSPGSVIVDFVISLLSPPVVAPGDMTTPAGSLEDRLKQVEEDVMTAVQEVIEEAADDGGLDDLGVDATSFVVTDVGVDVRVITEAPTTPSLPTTIAPPDTSPPAITCPQNMVVYLVPPDQSANVTWSPINATDDSGQVTVMTDMEQGLWDAGDYVIVVTAVDPAGNIDDCSFNITVKDRTCPSGWLRRWNSCYRLALIDPLSYAEAIQICAELDDNAPGAHPFIPNTHAEFAFAVELLTDLGLSYVWLGCGDEEKEGRYDCIDGSRFGRNRAWWAPGQPNHTSNENCIALVVQQGNIHDWYCHWNQPNAFCETPAE